MTEQGSTYSKIMIDVLLHVHALTNMHRASENDEFRKTASGWLPNLKSLLSNLEYELTKEVENKE